MLALRSTRAWIMLLAMFGLALLAGIDQNTTKLQAFAQAISLAVFWAVIVISITVYERIGKTNIINSLWFRLAPLSAVLIFFGSLSVGLSCDFGVICNAKKLVVFTVGTAVYLTLKSRRFKDVIDALADRVSSEIGLLRESGFEITHLDLIFLHFCFAIILLLALSNPRFL
jgi:hypothetical protein